MSDLDAPSFEELLERCGREHCCGKTLTAATCHICGKDHSDTPKPRSPMTTVRRKPAHDVAAAFNDWVNYASRPHFVKARVMETAFEVARAGAVMRGEAGDYLVIDLDGEPLAVSASVFEARYEVIKPAATEVSGAGNISSEERFGWQD